MVVCALLVPVPIGYIYPSRMHEFRTLTLVLSGLWLVAYAVLVAQLPETSAVVVYLSLAYIAYYVGLSLFLESKRRAARGSASVQTPVESTL